MARVETVREASKEVALNSERLAETAPAVQVAVNCGSNPETTRVKNNTNRAIKVKTVGFDLPPLQLRAFVVNRTLRPNKTTTFESGSNELTTGQIYNNDVGTREGTRVKTSVGTFIDRC